MNRTRLWLLAIALGCGPATHDGVGTVTEVRPELRQIMLDHEAIEGLMPAMTMNFDVPDPALLSGISAGDRVRFQIEVDGRRHRIVSLQRLGAGESGAGAAASRAGLAAVVPEQDIAPAFTLIDQDGSERSLEGLRGSPVLLDFIYTRCPGPCPILTSARVEVQRALPDALRARVRFVSISLDPEHDTPATLRSYALARGADLASWSFLSGEPATVDGVLQRYGVGKVREADGEIEHVVVTFLIDPEGRIAKRYFGLDHGADEFLRDLAAATPG